MSCATTVVLVGFMGAGKSHVGAALAERLGLPFVDCDALIEREAGPIPQIFAERGEEGFRKLERDVVTGALRRALVDPAVVALGGGAVLSADVRSALARFPNVVWLTAPLETLWRRVSSAPDARPLARDEAGFRRLFEERAGLYAQVARVCVANDGTRSAGAVVDELTARLPAACAGVRGVRA